ncbi:MAG: RHS repeat-associated core domain-containing protein, partial [Acidobacteriota bacterium]|nr:RHS repeat-associated core domain-containing protein [Acidobacteriota bacterium]
TAYYNADGLGSITSLTGGTGVLASTYTYDSFGNTTATEGIHNPFRYTGREHDTETGLYYYRARYYDPSIGRFVSEDPVRFKAGVNFYPYVMNAPTFFVDPLGLDQTIWDGPFSGNGRGLGDGPRNGNWGGKNWSGGWNPNQHNGQDGPLPPTDSADACYMAHDKCYEGTCGKPTCDQTLVKCLKALPNNPRNWPMPPRPGTDGDSSTYRGWAIWYFGK